jgi:phospholipid/cholesterol/gamma-HCH transport system permease protein
MHTFYHFGRYFMLLHRTFRKPEKWKVFFRQLFRELENLGLNSIGIVLISRSSSGSAGHPDAYNMENPAANYLIGLMVRDTMLLEFSSTIVALILAGKAGSSICSEIGTMRISEQIDAIEIMGVNSASYLILPKVVAAVLFFPLLSILSMFVGIFGGWITIIIKGLTTSAETLPAAYSGNLLHRLLADQKGRFCLCHRFVPAYHGYYSTGVLEVGKAIPFGGVQHILVLMFNYSHSITTLMIEVSSSNTSVERVGTIYPVLNGKTIGDWQSVSERPCAKVHRGLLKSSKERFVCQWSSTNCPFKSKRTSASSLACCSGSALSSYRGKNVMFPLIFSRLNGEKRSGELLLKRVNLERVNRLYLPKSAAG